MSFSREKECIEKKQIKKQRKITRNVLIYEKKRNLMKIKIAVLYAEVKIWGISVLVPDSERGLSAAVKDKIKPK